MHIQVPRGNVFDPAGRLARARAVRLEIRGNSRLAILTENVLKNSYRFRNNTWENAVS